MQREQPGSKNGCGGEQPPQGKVLSGVSSAPAGEERGRGGWTFKDDEMEEGEMGF